MVEQIKNAIHGVKRGKRVPMIHYQFLKNAAELEGVDAVAFCRELAIQPTYAIELRKMIALARLMREMGDRIVSN